VLSTVSGCTTQKKKEPFNDIHTEQVCRVRLVMRNVDAFKGEFMGISRKCWCWEARGEGIE
jgi:hypothetical protein